MRGLRWQDPARRLDCSCCAPHNGRRCQKGNQFIGGLKAAGSQRRRNHRFEGFEFYRGISTRVHLRRLHVCVAKPEGDLSQICGRLQHRQRACVPQDVRRHTFRREGGACRRGGLDVFVEDVLETRPAHGLAAGIEEDLWRRRRSPNRQPCSQRGGGDFPERQGAFSATLAMDDDARVRLKREVSRERSRFVRERTGQKRSTSIA